MSVFRPISLMETFCVEITATRGSSFRSLTCHNVDAADERRAVKVAHKALDLAGFDRVDRVLVRVKSIWSLNRRAQDVASEKSKE